MKAKLNIKAVKKATEIIEKKIDMAKIKKELEAEEEKLKRLKKSIADKKKALRDNELIKK